MVKQSNRAFMIKQSIQVGIKFSYHTLTQNSFTTIQILAQKASSTPTEGLCNLPIMIVL